MTVKTTLICGATISLLCAAGCRHSPQGQSSTVESGSVSGFGGDTGSLVPAPQPEAQESLRYSDDPPAFAEWLVGWDFSEMSLPEETAFLAIMQPLTSEEASAQLNVDQQWASEESVRIFNDSVAYAEWAESRSPQELAESELAAWSITHPEEHFKQVQERMTETERAVMAASLWAITHANVVAEKGVGYTPEQKAALEAFHTPIVRPRPVVENAPFGQVPSTLEQ